MACMACTDIGELIKVVASATTAMHSRTRVSSRVVQGQRLDLRREVKNVLEK